MAATQEKLQRSAAGGQGKIGITVAPGVVISPTAFSEVGHDSNVNARVGGNSSAFVRSGAGVAVTAVGAEYIANIAGSASWLEHWDDTDQEGLKGGVSGNVAYLLMPGLTVTAGGLFEHDDADTSKDQTFGGFIEFNKATADAAFFVRGRYLGVNYLNPDSIPDDADPALAPLYRTSALDLRRQELSAGLIVGTRHWISAYGEASIAAINYINQEMEADVDRDGRDYHVKAGGRFTFSSNLRADLGWRYNRRDLDDRHISSFDSNGFDASLTWIPSPYFFLQASYDRTIGEPTGALSRLTDVRAFQIKASAAVFDGMRVSVRGRRSRIDEIGDTASYDATSVNASVTYDYTQRIQFYTNFDYEHLEEDSSDESYDRFRFGAGVRIAFDRKSPLHQASGWGPVEHMKRIRMPTGADLSVSQAYALFTLPSVRMETIVGGKFFDKEVGRSENHDGRFEGTRTEVRLSKFAAADLPRGYRLNFGASAFYSWFSDRQSNGCHYTATTDCAYINIVDFNKEYENNTGPFGVLHTTTERSVRYWGVALDAQVGLMSQGGSLKDFAEPVHRPLPIKIGVAMRGLHQETKLHAVDLSVPDPVDYKDDLDTYYYGAFVELSQSVPLNPGWTLEVGAQGGVYLADTEYEGRYLAYIPLDKGDYVVERGRKDIDETDVAFIGNIRLELRRQWEWGVLGIYGQAEYISHVPSVAFNSTDVAGGSPFGVAGNTVGTSLDSNSALNYAFGLKISMPLQ